MVEKTNRNNQISLKNENREDFECPICCELCVEPVMTPCKHLFCLQCQKKIMGKGMKCPLCRAHFAKNFVPVVDIDLQQKLAQRYTEAFEERKQELVDMNLWRGNKIPVRFAYGNLYREVRCPKKYWGNKNFSLDNWFQLFVCLNNDTAATQKFIKKVVYHLHETYKQPIVTIHEAPFLLERTAYGYFEIQIDIHFQPWTGMGKKTVNHMLSFQPNGLTESFDFEVDAEDLQAQKENKPAQQVQPQPQVQQKQRGKSQFAFGSKVSNRPQPLVRKSNVPVQPNSGFVSVGQKVVKEKAMVKGLNEMFRQISRDAEE